MKFNIQVDYNKDGDRMFGWYLYGCVERQHGIKSEYRTDTAMAAILKMTIEKYREVLKASGATVLANGRTCFEDKQTAMNVIPLLEKFVEKELLI